MTDKTIMNVLAVLFIIMIIFVITCNTKAEAYSDFNDYVNSPFKTTEKSEEQLRIDWEEFFGYDIFLPYYKLEMFKDRIKTECSFEFKNFRTELETNDILTSDYSVFYKLIWEF